MEDSVARALGRMTNQNHPRILWPPSCVNCFLFQFALRTQLIPKHMSRCQQVTGILVRQEECCAVEAPITAAVPHIILNRFVRDFPVLQLLLVSTDFADSLIQSLAIGCTLKVYYCPLPSFYCPNFHMPRREDGYLVHPTYSLPSSSSRALRNSFFRIASGAPIASSWS